MKKKILFGVSLLFGLMFINSGLNKFFNYLPMPKELPEGLIKTMTAFMAIGWLMPLIAVSEIVGGILFITNKYRALGAAFGPNQTRKQNSLAKPQSKDEKIAKRIFLRKQELTRASCKTQRSRG